MLSIINRYTLNDRFTNHQSVLKIKNYEHYYKNGKKVQEKTLAYLISSLNASSNVKYIACL